MEKERDSWPFRQTQISISIDPLHGFILAFASDKAESRPHTSVIVPTPPFPAYECDREHGLPLSHPCSREIVNGPTPIKEPERRSNRSFTTAMIDSPL